MINLTQRFNIPLLDTISATGDIIQHFFLKTNCNYNESQAWTDYQVISDTIRQQLNRIGDITYHESNVDGRYSDNLSLYDWMVQYVPGGHQSYLEQYIDLAYQPEAGLDLTLISSLAFLLVISPDTQLEDELLLIYDQSDQRYRTVRGN
jgi:monoamine oxidase